jgi:hypothetical protein
MSIALVVTRGYGNGTVVGSVPNVVRRGYSAGEAVTPAPGGVWRRRVWERAWRRNKWERVWRYRPVSQSRNPPVTLEKKESEERYFAVSFHNCPEVVAGETLSAPELLPASVTGLTIGAPAVTAEAFDRIPAGEAVAFLVTGGTDGETYEFAVRATASGGGKPVVSCKLEVVADYGS